MKDKRRVLFLAVSLLLVVFLAGGISRHFIRAHQEQQVARALAALDPKQIRSQLEKSIRDCYEREAARARRRGSLKERQKALREAAQDRDQKLAQVDDSFNSIKATIASGQASSEFLELTRILQEEGVDPAVEYLSQRELEFLGGSVIWGRMSPSAIRGRLAPLLEGVRLERDRGDLPAAQRLCEELLAADADWPEARDQHVATMAASGQRALGDEHATMAWQRFESARLSAERLVQLDPTNSNWQHELSLSYLQLAEASAQVGRLDAAKELLEKNFAMERKQAAADTSDAAAQRKLWDSCERFGDLCQRTFRFRSALHCYQQGLEIAKKRAASDPGDLQWQRNLAVSYEKVGVSLRDFQDAEEFFQKSLDIRKKLAVADPADPDLQHDLAYVYEKMGDGSRAFGAARAFYLQSLDIRKKLADADPADRECQRDVATLYGKLAERGSHQTDQLQETREFYQQELEIAKKLAAADAEDPQAQRNLAELYGKLGRVTQQSGQFKVAHDFYQQGFDIRTKLTATDPGDIRAIGGLTSSYIQLADLAQEEGELELAVQICERGASVLARIHQKPEFKQSTQQSLDVLKYRVEQYKQALTVAGPWDELLKKPASRLSVLLPRRCRLLASRRDIGGVAQAAEALRTLEPKSPANLYNSACGYVMCAKLAAGWRGAGPFSIPSAAADPNAKNPTRCPSYLQKAVELFQAALDAGYSNKWMQQWMQQDTVLAGLNDLPQFKNLMIRAPESMSAPAISRARTTPPAPPPRDSRRDP
jgi:tetratricopeptide (TPR) repeat protein